MCDFQASPMASAVLSSIFTEVNRTDSFAGFTDASAVPLVHVPVVITENAHSSRVAFANRAGGAFGI